MTKVWTIQSAKCSAAHNYVEDNGIPKNLFIDLFTMSPTLTQVLVSRNVTMHTTQPQKRSQKQPNAVAKAKKAKGNDVIVPEECLESRIMRHVES